MSDLTRPSDSCYLSTSPFATQELGVLLGRCVREGDLVILTGDLGAGKTNLTQGVARALGVSEPVTSPTFNILAIHEGDDLTLYHFDLYRLEDVDQLGDAGVLDIAGVEGVSLVEWGEPFAPLLGDDRLEVAISRVGQGAGEPARQIQVTGCGGRGRALAQAWDKAVADAPSS